MMANRYALLLISLGALLLVSCVVSLGFGPARVPVDVVWHILLNKLFGLGEVSWSAGQEHIVWLIRVPRMLLGALVGAGLALIGAVLQAVTRNPLADPHLLGVTSGATLGAVIVVLHVGEIVGLLTLPIAAFIGALLSMVLVLAIASRSAALTARLPSNTTTSPMLRTMRPTTGAWTTRVASWASVLPMSLSWRSPAANE